MNGTEVFERFKHNCRGFMQSRCYVIAFCLTGLLCDALSTVHFMTQRPMMGELHPVVDLAAQYLGPVVGPLVGFAGKAVAGFCVAVFWRRWSRHILIAVGILSLWAGWYNVWGYEMYTPNFLKYIPW